MARIGGLCYNNYICTLKAVGQINELYNHYTEEITIECVKVNHNLIVFLSFLSYRSNANIKVRFPTCLVLLNGTGAFVIPTKSLNIFDITVIRLLSRLNVRKGCKLASVVRLGLYVSVAFLKI